MSSFIKDNKIKLEMLLSFGSAKSVESDRHECYTKTHYYYLYFYGKTQLHINK